ncbi:MAG: putative ABC transporter permease [Clostridia bacterium]|nr:putative ABC transporter permease [Clostridia bacterium]
MKKQKMQMIKQHLIKAFWVFLIGSIVGCIVETLVGIIFDHSFKIRQGLIYGPFIPVYGIGAVMYYFIVSNVKDVKKVFVLSMVLGGAIEYFCSYFQELCFGTVSWDYSNMLLNIGGRTSLLFCICWGILGVLFIKFVVPLLQKIDVYLENKQFKCITAMLACFMILNIGISCAAGVRQNERVQEIEATTKMDVFLDKYYPDAVMDKVYSNKMNRTRKLVQNTI